MRHLNANSELVGTPTYCEECGREIAPWPDTRPTACSPAADAMCLRGPRAWLRTSHGGITDGQGWEIYKDASDTLQEEGNEGRPWSLWRSGEYVGNYPTPADAKADATPQDHLTEETR